MSDSAARTSEDEWIDANAPALDCPDALITGVWDYRWRIMCRHLVRTGRGWVITEFTPPGPGRGRHGAVPAAAGHHILDGRWLRDPTPVDDYVRFWFTDPLAAPRTYTEWITYAAWQRARITGQVDGLIELLPRLTAHFEAWERDSRHPSGLYWVHDLTDAMEFSVSGDGLRPSINSYQYGNARAVAQIASLAGDERTAEAYTRRAETLSRLVIEHLWDGELFRNRPMSPSGEDAYLATISPQRRMTDAERAMTIGPWSEVDPARQARELIGYLPWYVDLPGAGLDPEPALAQLVDPTGFWGTYGLRTVERRHPRHRFDVRTNDPRFVCRWNGPSWPFATSQTLTAMARILRRHPQLRRRWSSEYVRLLLQYAAAHADRGAHASTHLLDEDLDPDTGVWLTREWRRRNDPDRIELGRDYYHSTFVDLVVSGLIGVDVDDQGVITVDPLLPEGLWDWFSLRGLQIHGHAVDVVWDRTGQHDGRGSGLRVTADGRTIMHRPALADPAMITSPSVPG